MSNKTYQPKNSTVQRKWHLIDAKDQVLGRFASTVAQKLLGKGKTTFAPHVDCGDYVVIINAGKIRIKGNNKPTQKIHFRHSGIPGGDTMIPFGDFLKSNPERAVSLSIRGMLPKTRLRDRQMKRLKVFKGEAHEHAVHFAPPKEKKAASAEEGKK